MWHDGVLVALRKRTGRAYVVPRGGLFELVSAANYFGEIVEWFGYMLAADFAPPSVGMAVLTLGYLGSRGYAQHRFYLDEFEDYPEGRWAVIPFRVVASIAVRVLRLFHRDRDPGNRNSSTSFPKTH